MQREVSEGVETRARCERDASEGEERRARFERGRRVANERRAKARRQKGERVNIVNIVNSVYRGER